MLNCVAAAQQRIDSFSNLLGLAEAFAIAKSAGSENKSVSSDGSSRDIAEHASVEIENPDTESSQGDMSSHATSQGAMSSHATHESLPEMCTKGLLKLAVQLEPKVVSMTVSELRQLIEIFAVLAVQADSLVATISNELNRRKLLLIELNEINFSSLVHASGSSAAGARRTLFGEEKERILDSLRSRLSSFFSGDEKDEVHTDCESADQGNVSDLSETELLQVELETTLRTSLSVSTCVDQLQVTGQGDLGDHYKVACSSGLFELGRCEELLELYYRNDFQSESRASRFDNGRRREIAKDILTRLLPP